MVRARILAYGLLDMRERRASFHPYEEAVMEEYEGWFICDADGGCGWMGDVIWLAVPSGEEIVVERAVCPMCRKSMLITTETTKKESTSVT